MTTVVTGASGYIGRRLVQRLDQRGLPSVALSRAGQPGRFRNLHDGHEDTLDAWMLGARAVVHLAGRLVDDPSAPVSEYLEPNVVLTDRVLAAAVDSHVEVVVHASSRLVYPGDLRAPAVEDRDARPDTAYGLSKLWSEEVVRFRAAGRTTSGISLRLAQVTGGEHPGLGVINSFVRQAHTTGTLTVRGTGAAVREVVHLDDLVDALLAALGYRGPWCAVNIGGAGSMSIAEIAETVADCAGLGSDAIEHAAVESEDLSVYALDPQRRRAVLDWEPRTSMADIIADALQRKETSR